MRIALCLSGQPRGLPLSIELIKKNLIEPNLITDIFIHAWHDEKDVGKSYSSAQPSQNGRVGIVKQNTESLLLKGFQPKKWLIEPQKRFPKTWLFKSDPTANQEFLASNFYSVYMANELKIQHEKENNFIYDVVIRSRYDLHFGHKIEVNSYKDNLDKIIVMKKFQDDQDAKNNLDMPMVDIFAIGSSANIDVFSSVYPKMAELNKIIKPVFGENFLGRVVRVQNNIKLFKADLDLEILHRVVDLSKI